MLLHFLHYLLCRRYDCVPHIDVSAPNRMLLHLCVCRCRVRLGLQPQDASDLPANGRQVSPRPDITIERLDGAEEFLILACDAASGMS